MTTWERICRHTRLTKLNYASGETPTPPFLILFINSICNQTCEHCFYWRSLNQPDDLSFAELESLSKELGQIDNLNLSGGEPFLRKEFGEICRLFIRNNGVKQIYVPTNASFADKTIKALEIVLEEQSLELFACEISLDGMPEYHNRFRGMKDAFERAMVTYDALAKLQQRDSRLRIHCISTATSENMDQVKQLTELLYERCPQMDHHNLAMIRGDRKNPSLQGPKLEQYQNLYAHVHNLWMPREEKRFGSIMEPMLQWAKTRTAIEQRQVVPCRAGYLTGVVYANGDVSLCENHPPVGNLRKNSFLEIWRGATSNGLRESIAAKQCWCTNEVFLWPSINYQPVQLARAMMAAKPWRNDVIPIAVGPAKTNVGPAELKVLE